MSHLTYREFLDQVRTLLADLSRAELQEVILERARRAAREERRHFLKVLATDISGEKEAIDTKVFLKELEAFAERVESGAYCSGWGWDDDLGEEREWGDESWAGEMDQFFQAAQELVRQGDFALAEQAYEILFAVLEMGEEPGHLPGDPNVYTMLSTNLTEQGALFLRARFCSGKFAEPESLLAGLREYNYLLGPLTLHEITNCVDAPLPRQAAFLQEWLQFLKKQVGPMVVRLTQEAAKLQGGLAAVVELARQDPGSHPEGYLGWVAALAEQGDDKAMLKAAREALEKIPKDLTIRAKIANFIYQAGEKQPNIQLKLEGAAASFYAAPSLHRLLALYEAAWENNMFSSVKEEILERIEELRSENKTGRRVDTRGAVTWLSNSVFFHSLILGGDYEKLFDLCPGNGPLGWSTGDNPKPFLLASLLELAAFEVNHRPILAQLWQRILDDSNQFGGPQVYEKYKVVLKKVYGPLKLNWEEKEAHLAWCQKQVSDRVSGIVSNQYRRSYGRAAELVVAVSETWAALGRGRESKAFIDSCHKKYNRYSAFRRELREHAKIAGLT